MLVTKQQVIDARAPSCRLTPEIINKIWATRNTPDPIELTDLIQLYLDNYDGYELLERSYIAFKLANVSIQTFNITIPSKLQFNYFDARIGLTKLKEKLLAEEAITI